LTLKKFQSSTWLWSIPAERFPWRFATE